MDTLSYIFTSPRLGFRNWADADIAHMALINADEQVMRYFPSAQTEEQTRAFVLRMQQQYGRNGFCYFAVDRLEDGQFIGFIGLSEQTYPADFTPCVDVGWRLSQQFWGMGYATEGASACLAYGFATCGLQKIMAVCPVVNQPSEQVMIKAGMQKVKTFDHPLLLNDDRLRSCVLYQALPA